MNPLIGLRTLSQMTLKWYSKSETTKKDSCSGVDLKKEHSDTKHLHKDKENSTSQMASLVLSSEKASSISVEEMEELVQTDPSKGLSEDEAKKRKKAYGSNDFDAGEDLPLWKKYINQVTRYSIILLEIRSNIGAFHRTTADPFTKRTNRDSNQFYAPSIHCY